MRLILEIINENEFQQKDFHLDGKNMIIGRSSEADWQLSDEMNHISAKHVTVEYKDNLYFIKDTSTNGTYLKYPYRKLPKEMPIKINSMDIFIIGDYEIQARFLDDKVSYKDMSSYNPLLNNQKSISIPLIPDDDFLLEDESVMNNTFVKKESAQSFQNIVNLYEDTQSNMVDEMNNVTIIEDDEEEEINSKNSLYQHINIPKFNTLPVKEEVVYEVQEVKKSHNLTLVENNSLAFLGNKLGIDFEKLNSFEQEKILSEIADIVLNSLEGLKSSLSIKDKILDDLNIEDFNSNNLNLNPIRKGKESLNIFNNLSTQQISLSEAIKKSFGEIDNHNVAFHKANKNLLVKNLDKFSPKTLEDDFDRNYNFIPLKPKKFQMWDAYVHRYEKFLKEKDFMWDSAKKDFVDEYNDTIFTIKLTSI